MAIGLMRAYTPLDKKLAPDVVQVLPSFHKAGNRGLIARRTAEN